MLLLQRSSSVANRRVLHANAGIHQTGARPGPTALHDKTLTKVSRTLFSESGLVFLAKFIAYVRSLQSSATDAATENRDLSQSVALINLQSMQAQAHPAFHACI